jgi:hypothetical protein
MGPLLVVGLPEGTVVIPTVGDEFGPLVASFRVTLLLVIMIVGSVLAAENGNCFGIAITGSASIGAFIVMAQVLFESVTLPELHRKRLTRVLPPRCV